MSDYVAGEKRTVWVIVQQLFKNRRILWLLIQRDLKVRYADSFLGYLWSVLEPLMMGALYWFVFVLIFQRQMGNDPYIIFLLAGLLPWTWFNAGLTEGSKALLSQRALVASTALPRQIWVLRSVGGKAIEFIFSIPVLLLFMVFFPPQLNGALPMFLVAMLIQLVLLLGLGFLLAPLTMLYRDLDPVIRIVNRALFYASPIIYSIDHVFEVGLPRFAERIYEFNPISGIMEAYRAGFFPDPIRYDLILNSAIFAVVVFVIGWISFGRMERTVLKEV